MHSTHSLAVVSALVACLSATAALAQSPEIAGLVRAASDKHVLSCMRVVLEDSAGHDIDSKRTDERGLFSLVAPRAGIYRLRFELLDAKSEHGPVDTLADGAYLQNAYDLALVPRDSTDPPYPPAKPDDLRPDPNAEYPHYPLSLRDAGIEGGAIAEFVVDTAGVVDKGSIRIVRQTHPAFGDAVTKALERMRFHPQHERGLAVCQRVVEKFAFALNR